MSGSVSCGRYIIGLTYSRPLLRPRWCTSTIGAPSKVPPTRPSFARNSAMVFAFQSSGSLMSNSCRARSRWKRWDPVMEGPAAGWPSGVHPRAVADVEPDGLHHLERRALGEDVCGCEHACVLLDHGRDCGRDHLVQAALERRPDVLAVLLEEARQLGAVDRLPRALGDVRHVLLVQRHVVAGAEPAEVAADEVLPRVGERVRRRLDVAGD